MTDFNTAKKEAEEKGLEFIFHDLETDECGACASKQPIRHCDENNVFHRHKCLYFPSSMSIEDMEHAEYQYQHGDYRQ